MRKKRRVIKICIIVLVILMITAGIIVLASRRVPKGDISVRKYGYYDDKREEVSHKEYFLDESGRIIKEISAGDKGISSITENEYDSLGRLACQKERYRSFLFFYKDKSTENFRYYGDTDQITDCELSSTDGKEKKEHLEYDADGNLVYEEKKERYWTGDESNYTIKYNKNGIMIYREEAGRDRDYSRYEQITSGKPFVRTEYDTDNRIIRNYNWSTYGRGYDDEFDIRGKIRNLDSEIQLTEDGKYETIKKYTWYKDEEGNLQTDLMYVTYYNYSPDDTEAEYETVTYDPNGVMLVRELFDKQDRSLVSLEYNDGVESRRTETDYNAADPDFPGEQVYCIRTYTADKNGNMVLSYEEWMKKISYGIVKETAGSNDDFEIYRSFAFVDGVAKPKVEYVFHDNGFIKEKHTYSYYIVDYNNSSGIHLEYDDSYDNCDETLYEYDEHGNCVKAWMTTAEGEKFLEYEWEYIYRD